MTYWYTITGEAYHGDRMCRALTAYDVVPKPAETYDDVPDGRRPCGDCEPEPPAEATGDGFDNPYFEEVAGGVTVGPNRQKLSDRALEVARQRAELVEAFAWAIPNYEAVETLVEHAPIVEVGAGGGYWAWLVEQLDGEIVATDPSASHRRHHPDRPDPWTDVESMSGQEAVGLAGDAYTLFVCWPSPEGRWPTETLRHYEGDTVVYVGPGRGGVAGSDAFHRLLHEDYRLEEAVAIPTYLQCSDRLEVWTQN